MAPWNEAVTQIITSAPLGAWKCSFSALRKLWLTWSVLPLPHIKIILLLTQLIFSLHDRHSKYDTSIDNAALIIQRLIYPLMRVFWTSRVWYIHYHVLLIIQSKHPLIMLSPTNPGNCFTCHIRVGLLVVVKEVAHLSQPLPTLPLTLPTHHPPFSPFPFPINVR